MHSIPRAGRFCLLSESKEAKIFDGTFLVKNFSFSCRMAFLLSSPKEEIRKVPPFRIGGRRPEGLTLWTPAEDQQQTFPSSPAPGLTLQAGGYGSPAAGKPAVSFLRGSQRKRSLFWGKALPDRFCAVSGRKVLVFSTTLPPALGTFPSARRVGPRAGLGGMADRSSLAGDLGGRPPGRRPPIERVAPFLLTSFGDERSKANGCLPEK